MIRILAVILILLTPFAIFAGGIHYFYPSITKSYIDSSIETIQTARGAIVAFKVGVLEESVQILNEAKEGVVASKDYVFDGVNIVFETTFDSVGSTYTIAMSSIGSGVESVQSGASSAWSGAANMVYNTVELSQDKFDNAIHRIAALGSVFDFNIAEIPQSYDEMASSDVIQNDAEIVQLLANIEPSVGINEESPPDNFADSNFTYDYDDPELTAEAVLVPRAKTVISSSRDGKIKKIYFENGDEFKKGDLILEYHCESVRAQMKAAKAERQFAGQKYLTTSRLFNMDLSADIEVEQSVTETAKASAQKALVESQLKDCQIKADYDGRVVKKLANDNEYTRTDRVLLEVAAKGTLDVEFLLPSKALRWVNLDAPITLTVNETEMQYTGEIKQIYGEVDPVSQSIQIRAGLDDYDQPLLPGMSGQVVVDIEAIRNAGISGFLETSKQ